MWLNNAIIDYKRFFHYLKISFKKQDSLKITNIFKQKLEVSTKTLISLTNTQHIYKIKEILNSNTEHTD